MPTAMKTWPRNTAPMIAARAVINRRNQAAKAVALLRRLGYAVTLTKVDPTAPDVNDATMN